MKKHGILQNDIECDQGHVYSAMGTGANVVAGVGLLIGSVVLGTALDKKFPPGRA